MRKKDGQNIATKTFEKDDMCQTHHYITMGMFCVGCGKLLKEIKQWSKYTQTQKMYATVMAHNRLYRYMSCMKFYDY